MYMPIYVATKPSLLRTYAIRRPHIQHTACAQRHARTTTMHQEQITTTARAAPQTKQASEKVNALSSITIVYTGSSIVVDPNI